MADPIKVRLKDGDGKVLHPETDWSLVQNKPPVFTADWGSSVINKPFQITQDSSNDNVLTISGFDYFKFGDNDNKDKEEYSFGYCRVTSTEGTFPNYTDTITYTPAFVVTSVTHMIGKPDFTFNTYYRYNVSKNTWETFTPGSDNTVYIPRYFH